ncbi:MAG: hypothetical protein LBC53_03665 [Spirochaetaceae bacterium]|jgi:hypothetical protein|nr:hypothetical protein [Spirochaetaceae bacterium]
MKNINAAFINEDAPQNKRLQCDAQRGGSRRGLINGRRLTADAPQTSMEDLTFVINSL